MADNAATTPRVWSYDALRQAQIWVPVLADRSTEDRSRIGTVALPHYSPQHGPGHVHIHGPDRRELARWLFGIPGGFADFDRQYPARARKVDRVFEAFVEFDSAGRDFQREYEAREETPDAHRARPVASS